MKIYNKIKKEHLFIFFVLFTALVLFTYFDNSFNYTGLTTKNICTDKGYECCTEGKGTNYFSLDYSCPQDKECWSSCSEQVKEFNLITSSAVLDSVWNPIKEFFMNLFKREVRAGIGSECEGKPTLFTISGEIGGSHISKFISGQRGSYTLPVCSQSGKFMVADQNDASLILISLSSDTNAHVEIPPDINDPNWDESINYPFQIFIKPAQGLQGQISCLYQQTDPGSDYECLFSISEDTNAHVGACNQFGTLGKNVYCTITSGGRPPPSSNTCSDNKGTCRSLMVGCSNTEIETEEFSCSINNQICCITSTQQYTLTINEGTGNVKYKLSSETTYRDYTAPLQYSTGTSIILLAEPPSGFSFSRWSEYTTIITNPLTITIPGMDLRITANFQSGPSEIQPFNQQDYEVYWANDKVVALSFNKYIQRNSAQLPNIAKFKVYRGTSSQNLQH